MHWLTHAPSNIALIKYMGKRDASNNIPDNASLSYTLSHLVTYVGLEINDKWEDNWLALAPSNLNPTGVKTLHQADFNLNEYRDKINQQCLSPNLSLKGQQRFISHLQYLKKQFNYMGGMTIYSANNFPLGVGIASSASSFAALTRCAILALTELTQAKLLNIEEQANLSRLGSGSSCRSFYAPWCIWEEEKVSPIETPFSHLLHQVVVFSHVEKTVSSSEAHLRVQSSPHYQGRPRRAKHRLEALLTAMQKQDWEQMYQICFAEFMDMHQLFESSTPAFSYRSSACNKLLAQLQTYWKEQGEGPLITMDAGPTIHLLYRSDQVSLAQHLKETLLKPYEVL